MLISIDPGLDRAAAALWAGQPPADIRQAGRLLRDIVQCVTLPNDEQAVRFAQLAEWACHLAGVVRLIAGRPQTALVNDTVVIIEWPAFAGAYAGRTAQWSKSVQPMAKSMAGLYAATGAIVAGCSRWTDKITLVPAAKVKRQTKQLVGDQIIKAAVAAQCLRQGSKTANNDDVRSAVYVGMGG